MSKISHRIALLLSLVIPTIFAFSFNNNGVSHSRDSLNVMNRPSKNLTFRSVARDEAHNTPEIATLRSREDFLNFLAQDDRLCIINVYASWCKSCHKFGVKYRQLAFEYADLLDKEDNVARKGDVRFAQIEYGTNRNLCKSFGIKKLPYVQIYKVGVGKIDEFVCGPKLFDTNVKMVVESLSKKDNEQIEFDMKMMKGQYLANDLINELEVKSMENSTRMDT